LVLWWTLLPFTHDLSPGSVARALADVQWIPFVERGRPPLWSDVLGNLALFAPFGFAGWRFLEGRPRRLVLVLASAVTFSLVIEVVQLALPARRTSATDLATDALGALVGAGLGRLWEARGRISTRVWIAALARGENAHLFAALFALCLAAWALMPGADPVGGLWERTQSFSSSFRRFPGWEAWLGSSIHPFLLGWLLAALVSRSWHGSTLSRAVCGALVAVFAGLALETLQLLAPSRRPEIFHALAFALGGIPGCVTGLVPGPLALVAALLVIGAGLMMAPTGDNPLGMTAAVLTVGAVLAAWSGLAATRTVGEGLVPGAPGDLPDPLRHRSVD
jgi:VanZ family protein